MRSVARDFGVSLHTVQRWVAHAGAARLDRVDWSGHRGGRRALQATAGSTEDLILDLRQELRLTSDLGEFGAAAVHRELVRRRKRLRLKTIPSIRTISRIFERRGVIDGSRRVRRPAPPSGWYLPPVRDRRAALDSFDIVEGLVIKGGHDVEVLNGISLHGGLTMSRVSDTITSEKTVNPLIGHWRAFGFPDYAQFDNDTIFQGAHQWPDSFGRVTRLCLQLEITPVFAPPRETGFQAAPNHWEIPAGWTLDLSQPLSGTVIFIRRTDNRGHVKLLGHDYEINRRWCHRLVRCNVDLTNGRIRLSRCNKTSDPF